MPQRSSWLAVQTLINQHLTNLAILAEVGRRTRQASSVPLSIPTISQVESIENESIPKQPD
jgi:hypothetical protein